MVGSTSMVSHYKAAIDGSYQLVQGEGSRFRNLYRRYMPSGRFRWSIGRSRSCLVNDRLGSPDKTQFSYSDVRN